MRARFLFSFLVISDLQQKERQFRSSCNVSTFCKDAFSLVPTCFYHNNIQTFYRRIWWQFHSPCCYYLKHACTSGTVCCHVTLRLTLIYCSRGADDPLVYCLFIVLSLSMNTEISEFLHWRSLVIINVSVWKVLPILPVSGM